MRMQRGWTMKVPLLVLGLLSLMTPLACAQDPRYEDLVNGFIKEYNSNSGSENLFRLSILNLKPGDNNDPVAPRPVSFTIRETVCSNTENRNPDDCGFKENGLVKECIGTIALDSPKPSVDISCDGPERIKRFGVFKKIQEGLRNLGNKIRDRIRDFFQRV
ncbi:cathelicidin antimicrobial peptide-like [Dromiciops gliroides]|uniref:cathelicidin antimicrobial peptide-like n=1 Tax=Dromiciops gliroides TaxID=33562 RepID=UPI001CC3AE0E|nr:cathelicidin antimicrobial peptide-like [Dromiciops gliroides]